MHVPRATHRIAIVAAMLSLGAGCNNPVFVRENRPLETQPTPAGQMPPEDGLLSDTDLFVLPVRKPTGAEAKALKAEQTKLGLMMPVPWVGLRDVDIEIEWTLKNLETTDIQARVTINGGNEFGDYDKAMYVDMTVAEEDQAAPPDVLGGGVLVPIAAGALLHGVFREDELHEAGIDLEAITRYPPADAGLNEPFEVLTRLSSASTVGLEAVPPHDVTPAMVRMQVLLEATGHATLDYAVRVREHGSPNDKLAQRGAKDLYVSTAAVLAPPVTPAQPTFTSP